MERTTKLLFSSCLALIFTSCFEPEEFSLEPQIEFVSLDYIDTEVVDSLILSFRFEDGNGDIGLDNEFNDLIKPYQVFNTIIDAEDSLVTISGQGIILPFFAAPILIDQRDGETVYFFFPEEKSPIPFSETDHRPSYNCEDYEIINADTFYVERNEFHHNFHIEFLKKNNGNYSVMDFRRIFNSDDCTLGNFDGRIPIFDPNGKEGVISYAMLSQAFRLAFQDDTIRLRFYIYDRTLNRSNTTESPDFVFTDLL